mmetsp:Transcript_13800/g.29374  ORF Transcript_13800/g.29374 Transcript_13800/m.29374 type:complete len:135 (+) Transcript_13800:1-405(+)
MASTTVTRISVNIIPLLALFALLQHAKAVLNEDERVSEYHKRKYTWPPLEEEYVPNTEGWKRIMKRRLEQVRRIEDRTDMYNGWVATIHTGLIAPNFTEYGWAVTKAPQGLMDELLSSLHRGLRTHFHPAEPAM